MARSQPPGDSKSKKSRPKSFVAKASSWLCDAVEGGKHSDKPAPEADNKPLGVKSLPSGSATKSPSYKVTKARSASSERKTSSPANKPPAKAPESAGDLLGGIDTAFSTSSRDVEDSQEGPTQPRVRWSERARATLLNDQPLPDYYGSGALASEEEEEGGELEDSAPENIFEPPVKTAGSVTKLLAIHESLPAEPHRALDLYHTNLRDETARGGQRPSHKRAHSYVVDDEIYEAPKERTGILPSKPYDAMRANEVQKLLAQDVAGLAIYEKEVEDRIAEDVPNIGCQLKFYFAPSGLDLSEGDLKECVKLVEHTSGQDYKSSSIGWKPKKKEAEMKNKDMMFLLIRVQGSGRLVGFMSFTFEHDDPPHQEREVLYLYEIHLMEMLRGRGLGSKLLKFLEAAARHCGVTKTMLTVFVANGKAQRIYDKVGYVKDSSSPEDRVVRSKVKKADYLIMSKEL